MNTVVGWLAATTLAGAGDGELAIERALAAAELGRGATARTHATEALTHGAGPEAWEAYVIGSRAAGVWPLAREELADLAETDAVVRVIWTAARVRDGEAALDDLRVVAEQEPTVGRTVLATSVWQQQHAPEALALAPEDPNDPAVARLRLAVLASVGAGAEAAVVASTWSRRHPDHPEVLAELWSAAPPLEATATVRKRLLGRLGSQLDRDPDPVWLYRAGRVFQAAHDGARLQAVNQQLLAARLEPLVAGEPFAAARDEAERALQGGRADDAVRVWESLRARGDSVEAALEHAWLLQLLDRPAEALPIAERARSLAAAPGPNDAAGLDTAGQAARLADAHGLIAELCLALARPDTARAAVAVAHAIDPHPRWAALTALTRAVGEAPGQDPGLPDDPKVTAVIDTLLAPTDGPLWAKRAALHQADGESVAAFAAWVIARAHGVDVGDAVAATWDGPGNPDAAAVGALVAFHGARRGHREALAALRAEDGGAAIEPVPLAPGVGLRLPAWEAAGLDGAPIRSQDLAGTPYLLSLWATWCMPCLMELPAMAEGATVRAAAGRPVRVVAISVDERASLAARLVADRDWQALQFGWNPELGTVLGVDGLPTSLVIDGEGRVRDVSLGYDPRAVDRMLDAAASRP